MKRLKEPGITRQVVEDTAYYTLRWSAIRKVDKFAILKEVPSVPGIYELYYLDDYKKLVCFYIARVWYGGLRGSIREATDPLIVLDEKRIKVMNERECYFRYTVVYSFSAMRDLMNLIGTARGNQAAAPQDSGSYAELFLKEESPETD